MTGRPRYGARSLSSSRGPSSPTWPPASWRTCSTGARTYPPGSRRRGSPWSCAGPARHGGIAICAPIAPYEAARAQVRRMVSEVGDFLLIHVATPVAVCEARDRKGLYAKARAGLIDHFTGISDQYEEPRNADLTIDTSVMSRQEAVEAVLRLLTGGGWLKDPAAG